MQTQRSTFTVHSRYIFRPLCLALHVWFLLLQFTTHHIPIAPEISSNYNLRYKNNKSSFPTSSSEGVSSSLDLYLDHAFDYHVRRCIIQPKYDRR